MKYGKIDGSEFTFLISLLERKIDSFPEEKYENFLGEAGKLSPHGEQTNDDAYFALALKFNAPIWSDETAFKEQSDIKVFSTKEVLELLG